MEYWEGPQDDDEEEPRRSEDLVDWGMHQQGQFGVAAGYTGQNLGQGDCWDWEGGPCVVEERPDPERVVGHAMGW